MNIAYSRVNFYLILYTKTDRKNCKQIVSLYSFTTNYAFLRNCKYRISSKERSFKSQPSMGGGHEREAVMRGRHSFTKATSLGGALSRKYGTLVIEKIRRYSGSVWNKLK